MKQGKKIESLMGLALILVSGSIFVSFPVDWEASATTEEEQEDF